MLSVGDRAEECDDAVGSVKFRAERADDDGVSDTSHGYQPSDVAAGLPFLPRLPEPAPRPAPVSAEPAMMASYAPSMPAAAAPMGAEPGAVATMERRAAEPPGPTASDSPPEMVPDRPPRRSPKESIRLFVNALPVILLAVLVVGSAFVFFDRMMDPATMNAAGNGAPSSGEGNNDGEDDTLPRYTALPPSFGTATYHLVIDDGVDARVTFNGDGSQVWFEFFPFSAVTPDSSLLANPGATFVRDSVQGWVLADVQGSSQFSADLTPLRMMTFGQFVPEELRSYVKVEAHRTLTLSGREVDEYSLQFDVAAMRAKNESLTQLWTSQLGMTPGASFALMTLSVDAQGVVWKVVSDDPAGPDAAWTLEFLGQEQFAVQFPTTYYNAVTGEQVTG